MRKFTFVLSLFMLLFVTAYAQADYTPSFTGSRTSNRSLSTIRLSSPSYPDHSANSVTLTTAEKNLCYTDNTAATVMKVGAGETVTMTVTMDGSWLHSYVYIDADNNGFDAAIADGSSFLPTGDLMSYSFYNNNSSSDESGWNSVGTTITGDNRNTVNLPQFTAPQQQGTYRMRIKLDWCNIDPAGDNDGKFGDFMANGGHIVDVMVEVAEQQQVVSELFSSTTVANGQFAQETVWYTLQIAANGWVIDNGDATNIALDNVKSDVNDGTHLWAFVGDNTNGYRLYNKHEGAGKVLAAPVTMSGTTGSASYPILVDAANVPSGYTDLWLFEASSDLGEGDTYYYMYEKGYPANKVNNRDNKLAFWNTGQDAGSTLNIRFARAEYPINVNSGEWTASNAAGTWAATWRSTNEPYITLSQAEGKNNMAAHNDNGDIQLFTCLAAAAVDGVYSSVYSVAAEEGYSIEGYRFDFVSSGTSDVTVTTADGTAVAAGSTAQNVSVSGKEENSLSFTVSASSNLFANTTNFYATIVRAASLVEPSQDIFITNSGGIPYRIPAIATASNGDLIAVADYRHSGADIGVVNNGRIDLLARISNDNGANWGNEFAVVLGQGASSPDFMHVGFGDPCIVADRESNRVLILSCAGNVSFQSGTRSNHQNIARFYSNDNGVTWSEPEDIAESIYSQFDDSAIGPVMAMFIGSGKIHQSRYVKVNDYYRLYCAVLAKDKNANYINFVLYSDDFGGTWNILGTKDKGHCTGADEPKVEELPNGNIILSSRTSGGRHYNIFTFTDAEKAEGSWGTQATSNSSVNGVVALGNSTNGEIMLLPVVRNEDNEKMWIALQSVPFGSGRNNVGIYYKELASESDYDTPANFAKDWDGRHQASYLPSAYSTMCLQKDTTIAFLYEEETYGAGYTIVYKNYTLEHITDSAYSIDMAELYPVYNTLIHENCTPDNAEELESLKSITLTFAKEITIANVDGIEFVMEDIVEETVTKYNITASVSADNAKQLVITINEGLPVGEYFLRIAEGAVTAADGTFNPAIEIVYNVNYSAETFEPTSYSPAPDSTVEVLEKIVMDYSPEYPGHITSGTVVTVTDMNGVAVTTGSIGFATSSYYAVEITLADKVEANGTYMVVVPAGAVWNNKWSGGVVNGGRYNPELILMYTVNSGTGIDDVLGDDNAIVEIYDLTGRKVAKPVKGVYIINGKKRIIK